jgi:MerC mercury resistance protein
MKSKESSVMVDIVKDLSIAGQTIESSASITSFDVLGIAASTICLIHCLSMPFLISLLPLIGWQFMAGKLAHQILAAFVFTFALFAIVPGYLKHHKKSVLIAMLVGLGLVAAATFICGTLLPEKLELPMITIGNIILVITHWHNHHLASCKHHG